MPRPREPRPLTGMPDFLAYWRRDRDLADVPTRYAARLPYLVPAPRREGLTQLMVATMAGVRERHYAGFERAGGRGYSRTMIAALVDILGLTGARESALYRWGQHRPPRTPAGTGMDEALARRLHELPHIALCVDRESWDVLAYNEPAAYHAPALTAPAANLARIVLGPHARRGTLLDWEQSWARPMIDLLRAAVAAPDAGPRLREVVAAVRADPATRRIWDSAADMRAHVDGEVWPALIPTLARHPVRLESQAWIPERRPDLRMVVAVPVTGGTEVAAPARSVPSAQRLADAVLVVTEASLVTVNYTTGPAAWHEPSDRAGTVDVRMRRAAIAVVDGREVPPGFLRPGDRFPPLPDGSDPIQRHRLGGHVLLDGHQAIAEALGNDPSLTHQLIPGPDVTGLIHAPLTSPSGAVLGSVEAWQVRGGQRFTDEHLATLRHLARVRAAAMSTALIPEP
jgi:GAF domain-containing protein